MRAVVGRVVAVATIACALVVLVARVNESASGDPIGANDFVQYWTAFEVATDGGDAYDADELEVAQARVGLQAHAEEPLLFWNPPWTLVLLSPLLTLSFDAANAAWFVANLGLVLFTGWASWALLVGRRTPMPPLALAGAVLFLPCLETLIIGQLGALVAAIATGTLLLLRRGHLWAAGVLLGLWSVKPQTLLVLAAVLAVHVVARRLWPVLLAAAGTTAALYALSAVWMPETTQSWSPLQGPTVWRTASLPGLVRSALDAGGEPPTWPIAVIPLLGLALTVPYALRHRDRLPWVAFPVLAAAGLAVAPHAWIFDGVLLAAVPTVLLGLALRGDRRAAVGFAAVAAVQLAGLWFRSLEWTHHQHLGWVPVLVGLAWLPFRPEAGPSAQPEAVSAAPSI